MNSENCCTTSWVSGSLITAHHPPTNSSLSFIIEKVDNKKDVYVLLDAENPLRHLKYSPQTGEVSYVKGVPGRNAHVAVLSFQSSAFCNGRTENKTVASVSSDDSHGSDNLLYAFCTGTNSGGNKKNCNMDGMVFLGYRDDRSLAVGLPLGDCTMFHIREVCRAPTATVQIPKCLQSNASQLPLSTRISFVQNGYVILRNIVPLPMVDDARRRINHDLGKVGSMIPGGVEGYGKLGGNVSNSQQVMKLIYESGLWNIIQSLLGCDVIEPSGAQIALRFPEMHPSPALSGKAWHTDGMRQGKLNPFLLLAGIALSDCMTPDSGNLVVFPGSHARLHSMMLPGGRLKGYEDIDCSEASSVWGDGTLPDLGQPMQLLMSRGDVVLAHPMLAHRGGPNPSADIRYQVYFRIRRIDQHEHQEIVQDSAWSLYPQLKQIQYNT